MGWVSKLQCLWVSNLRIIIHILLVSIEFLYNKLSESYKARHFVKKQQTQKKSLYLVISTGGRLTKSTKIRFFFSIKNNILGAIFFGNIFETLYFPKIIRAQFLTNCQQFN